LDGESISETKPFRHRNHKEWQAAPRCPAESPRLVLADYVCVNAGKSLQVVLGKRFAAVIMTGIAPGRLAESFSVATLTRHHTVGLIQRNFGQLVVKLLGEPIGEVAGVTLDWHGGELSLRAVALLAAYLLMVGGQDVAGAFLVIERAAFLLIVTSRTIAFDLAGMACDAVLMRICANPLEGVLDIMAIAAVLALMAYGAREAKPFRMVAMIEGDDGGFFKGLSTVDPFFGHLDIGMAAPHDVSRVDRCGEGHRWVPLCVADHTVSVVAPFPVTT